MLRLDYVSPLPPTRTGIADYSADLLPHLAALADVRLVALPGQEVSAELRARWPMVGPEALGVVATGSGGVEGAAPRLPLYQMGNNHLHEPVWEAALRVPGVLVLHDLVLHHFLLGRTIARRDLDGYRDQLAADHGWAGVAAARPVAWSIFCNTLQFALPARRTLLRAQRGVLVHGRWAREELLADDPSLHVVAVPMPVPLPPAIDAGAGTALRARLGIPAGAPVLGSFGFQTPMKRTEVVIRALARPDLQGAHLIVAGEESRDTHLGEEALAAGVGDRVHVLGYVPFALLEEAIAASDLCLNLRYPTAGETSASLLRILAGGRPAIVNDFAQFRELPDAAVVKVPLGADDEAAALAAHVAKLLAAPEGLRRMGAAAREHVRVQHDPARAAAAMVGACAALAGAEPPPPRPLHLDAPSAALLAEVRGEIAVEPLAGWRDGERRDLRIRVRNTGRTRWLATRRGTGGFALSVELRADDDGEAPPWLELPRDLPPGEEHAFAIALRRPLGPARLRVVPRLLGVASDLPGAPVLDREV